MFTLEVSGSPTAALRSCSFLASVSADSELTEAAARATAVSIASANCTIVTACE